MRWPLTWGAAAVCAAALCLPVQAQDRATRVNCAVSDPLINSGFLNGAELAALHAAAADNPNGVGWYWHRTTLDHLNFDSLARLLPGGPSDDFAASIMHIQDRHTPLPHRVTAAKVAGPEPVDAFLTRLNAPATRETRLAGFLQGPIGVMQVMDRAHLKTQPAVDATHHLWRSDADMVTARKHTFVQTPKSRLAGEGAFITVRAFHLPSAQGMIAPCARGAMM